MVNQLKCYVISSFLKRKFEILPGMTHCG